MLQFILGRAKSGKTNYLYNLIKDKLNNKEQIIVFVPEQFTFETEKALFEIIEPNLFTHVTVTSFTRFCKDVFHEYGDIAGNYMSDSAKLVLMEMSIHEMSDSLDIYKKSSKTKSFIRTMIDTVTELKHAGISPDILIQSSINIKNDYLLKKTNEISALYGCYDGLLHSTYKDSLDDINRAINIIRNKNYFKNKNIILHEFKGFTANENDMIKLMINNDNNTYVSLCLDIAEASINDNSNFASVFETYNKIKSFAREKSVIVSNSINLYDSDFISDEIKHIEQNLFSYNIEPYEGNCNNIKIKKCKNEYEEIEYTVSRICELVFHHGYKYNDICIVVRDFNVYEKGLINIFKKYEVPYYMDIRYLISCKPIIRFVESLLKSASESINRDVLIDILKCDCLKFSIEDICEFENYLFVWDIKPNMMDKEFTNNPRGFKTGFSNEDIEILSRINNIREFLITEINIFKNNVKDSTGILISDALISVLNKMNIKENLEVKISHFYTQNMFEQGDEYSQVWAALIDIISVMSKTIGDKKISINRFYEIFCMICEDYDIGELPCSIDCVLVGTTDRIRVSDKKIVFILGVNEHIIPFTPKESGLFTNRERKALIENDMGLQRPIEYALKEERFIAYKTLTSAKEKLYLTCRLSDLHGKSLAESNILHQLEQMFSDSIIVLNDNIKREEYIFNKKTAFFEFARHFDIDDSCNATIKELLLEDTEYLSKISHLARVNEKLPMQIFDKSNAEKIFKKDIYVSPTKVENFYKCRFKYFCENGLRVSSLSKAELNPLETGNLIHDILYNVTQNIDLKERYDKEEAKKQIEISVNNYIEQTMGGKDDKTKRFIYLVSRLKANVMKILDNLHKEFIQSEFYPEDFEMEIGQGDVSPLKLTTKYGSNIYITGKVDRVDSYIDKNGDKYIRIIDYKSGKKEFSLADIISGLNLQMLLYLHVISKVGKGKYKDVTPAGVLYMPAQEAKLELLRDDSTDKINETIHKNYKMNGLLINDTDVLNAMEKDMNGLFIPVKLKKDGSIDKSSQNSLVSLNELAKINKYIEKLILNMAKELHLGNIHTKPNKDICQYCDYSGVCGDDISLEVKREKFSRDDIFNKIDEVDDE